MGSSEDLDRSPAALDEGELRAIADQLLTILGELRAIEEQKRETSLGSEAFVSLAETAEAQGRLAFRWTGLQLELAREVARRRATGEIEPDVRIVDIQPKRLDRILASWREAQFRLELAKPGTAEADAAADRIERLQDEYRAVAKSQAADAAALGEHPGSG